MLSFQVKFWIGRQTDNGKTIYPLSIDSGHKNLLLKSENYIF